MKMYLVTIFFYLTLDVLGQAWFKEGKEFNSFFKNFTKGHFNGMVSGILAFESQRGDNFTYSFSEDSAYLSVVPDPDKVYDLSYKYYAIKKENIQIEYGTYANANAMSITMAGVKYQLNLFDGACIYVIKGLEYKYIPNGENELLIIHFSDNVGLCSSRCYTIPEMFIKKGSTLIFTIEK